MTSEETSLGIYPVETTSTMAKILKASEDDILVNELDESDGDVMEGENDKFDKIAAFAESEDAAAIISFDNDWEQTVKLSCRRSYLPIIAIAGQSIVANQMCMLRGVSPVYDEAAFDKKDINAALRTNLVQKGDTVVVVSNGGDTVEIKTM
jgi:pyruvate kinase